MGENVISPAAFGGAFKQLLTLAARAVAPEEPVMARHLRAHFEADPSKLPIVTQEFKQPDHPNVQVALEEAFAQPGRSVTLLGYSSGAMGQFTGVSLADLVTPAQGGLMAAPAPTEGPVQFANVALRDRSIACVRQGLYLLRDNDQRLAILIRVANEMFAPVLHLEVMAPDRRFSERFIAAIQAMMRGRNVYRGQVLSLESGQNGQGFVVRLHALPQVARDQIILPDGMLERIERQSIRFSQHAERLKALGRHLRRGILLYGPPGTGKTLSAMYLATQMQNRTVLLATGRSMGLIEEMCHMARALAPATVILEDVDLIAEERTAQNKGCNVVLFELLNQMDGLADDADILFLLTTNRPDMLEPALASRPGRIDMAIEVPVPDASCRRRLFELYGRGLRLDVKDLPRIVSRTEGVSAAFIRELIRKAALDAAEGGDEIVVRDEHLDHAIHDLIVDGGPLTRSLLGASVRADA